MFATISLLLATLPLSLCEPICQKPPPPASDIPNITDCHDLINDIYAASKLQGDEPILWSQSPSAFVRNRKLPYSFKNLFASSDCEFIVDALHEGSQDTFPTKLIGEGAEQVVQKCMEQGIDGAETVGAVAVGPKRVIAIVLTKRWSGSSMSGGTFELNMTNVTLLGPGIFSGLSPSLIEDG